MALANLSSNTLYANTHSLSPPKPHQPTFSLLPKNSRSQQIVKAVHAAEPAKTPVSVKETKRAPGSGKWSLESWKDRKALQLPEYPNEAELETVLKSLESFPPLVFAGEARSLEEKIAEAAMGNAFLLQGGDCAESFKEFNANNIRDTFRVMLQMSVVLMFGGQMPVVKVLIFFLHFYLYLCSYIVLGHK